ncbi:TadE/TadG family type IV pilus assembly protein [Algihabitans albus]|uniref:TadE/TadG family type IV pilus assembly protein n=1 Tax=Algihabitans albus TaxID=2164067 RepID=UPI000E5CC54A|nr:TadE/TadG family type IV pilus assembly protein [Algihabitans albus]
MIALWSEVRALTSKRTSLFRLLRWNRKGTVLVEMAVVTPLLLILLLGAVEFARYVLIMQKLDRAAMSVGDLVSRGAQVTPQDLVNIFDSVEHLMQPFSFPQEGVVLISAVTRVADTPPEVVWQQIGAGDLVRASRVGLPGDEAVLPQNLQPRENESLYVAEVYYSYAPLIFDRFVQQSTLYHWSVFRARLSDQVITIN